MYNVPFQLTNYPSQQQQQDNGNNRKTFPSPLTVSSMDSPPPPTDTVVGLQLSDQSYQKLTPTTFNPWSTGSPTPTNSTASITTSKPNNNNNNNNMDNNNISNSNNTINHQNMERHFNINTPSFKQQQPLIRHPNPSPSTSSNNIPKNNDMFYSPNDQWALTHPPHLLIKNLLHLN
ncbi:unnamed protein product [Cunninghamella echinulata]